MTTDLQQFGRGDCITIQSIHALGVHGALEFEHHQPQDFIVDVSLWFDSREAARADDLELTVNYAQVTDKVLAVVRGHSVALIERLARNIAMSLLEDSRINAVEITVHKPHAPLPVDFSDVAVTIYRTRQDYLEESNRLAAVLTVRPTTPRKAILALGANLGDPVGTLREVVAALQSAPEFSEVKVSPLARTRPVLEDNQSPQPDYYNAVVSIVSKLSAADLLDLARHFEEEYHRERVSHWAPRTLDVDIICIDDVESEDPRLTLPHPRAAGRAFVLVPWMHLDPQARLDGVEVSRLAQKAQDRSGIVSLWPDWLEQSSGVTSEAAKASKEAGAPSDAQAFGLPSWQAALGNPAGEQRVVDDVTGEIYLENQGEVQKPSWSRVKGSD